MQTLRHLVAGTDFSECAQRGLEVAIWLAGAAGARVTVVHVCELDGGDLDDRRLMECEEALLQVVVGHRLSGVEVTGLLRCGKPWEKLDNVAAEVGATLIVIGRCGAGRGRSVEIGSVANQLVRSTSRSVLTISHEFHDLDV